MISITTRQLDHIIKQHDLPGAYRDRFVAALKAAYQIGRDADCMHVKHKELTK